MSLSDSEMQLSDAEFGAIVRTIVPSRLKSLRLSHGLSQIDMAARIRVSEKSYRNYELGKRDLPQSTRLKVIWEFQFDLLPTEQVFDKLVLSQACSSAEGKIPPKYRRNFWKDLRAECCLHRKIRYSRPAQKMLHYRDMLYFTASSTFMMNYICVNMGVFDNMEIGCINLISIGSVFIMAMLLTSILPEIPLFKVAQHYLSRKVND